MAAFHGKSAMAWFRIADGAWTQFTRVRSWTCSLTAATADTTGMAATTGRTRIAGLNSGTCSIECVYDSTTLIQVDETDNDVFAADTTGIQIELYRDGTDASKGYHGGAQCTGVDVSVAMDDTPIVTYNFQWVGEVTEAVVNGTP